jgi:serine/threonine-protein kinase
MSEEIIGTGRTLGRYELLVPIAEGGMASVWAARMKGQRGFQKIVAIKQMKSELNDDTNFEIMFLDEAALVSRLRHPNLAEILDLGEEEDVLYQVMEFVDGEPLNRLLRQSRGGIPIPLAVRIAKEAAAGLQMAHELRDDEGNLVNLVHRDVSLQNILVTYDGVTKVIDFGVAKAMSNLQKTNVGQVKGKVPYMSPEQAVGEPLDRRTDIFALGIVLYQLITGKHPFRGDSDLETIMRICDTEPVQPPSTHNKLIPPELDALVGKALAKQRNARFATMSEMQRALEVVLPADQQASSEDIARFMQRHLGDRGEKRRISIQEAGRALDQAAVLAGGPKTIPPPVSSRGRMQTLPPSARVTAEGIAGVADFPGVGPRASNASNASNPLAAPPMPSARSLGLDIATPPGGAFPLATPPPPSARSLGLETPAPTSARPLGVPPPPPSFRSGPPPLPGSPEHRPNRTVPPPVSGTRPTGSPMTRTHPSGAPPPSPSMAPPAAPAAPAGHEAPGSSLRTGIFALLAAGFGLLIGYAAFTFTGDSLAGSSSPIPLAVPSLTKIRTRVRLTLPTSPAHQAPTAAPAGSAPDGPGKK